MHNKFLSLDDVKLHFEHWRSVRTKRERIPQYLWDEVKTLIESYLLTDITSALRINTRQIKDRLEINKKIKFAEVRINAFQHLPQSFSEKEQTCSIEWYRANGVVLKISALSVISLQKIISQFME